MKGDGDIRIFVALFSYDPASMSPNPDAAEEELPFSEGQILKVRPHTRLTPRRPRALSFHRDAVSAGMFA